MPHYVSLFDWTDQGVRNAKDSPGRYDEAARMAQEKYGVRIRQHVWTVGPHDVVGFVEAPDDESLSAFLLELASAGNLRSTTLRAYDRDEMSAVLGRMG